MLSERRHRILSLVVDSYLESGRPVGSKSLAGRDDVPWSASTVRAELAELESDGFLTHPHTSAGRTPTDSGYRFYADTLLASG
ncbi:MAG: heat-inducible transcriptional repressor HrcA, partial [Solirubrobacterales bacterium]